MTTVALPHGLVAQLVEDEFELQEPAQPVVKMRPPRRWSKNGHLWESCACFDCSGRRAGVVPSGYGVETKS